MNNLIDPNKANQFKVGKQLPNMKKYLNQFYVHFLIIFRFKRLPGESVGSGTPSLTSTTPTSRTSASNRNLNKYQLFIHFACTVLYKGSGGCPRRYLRFGLSRFMLVSQKAQTHMGPYLNSFLFNIAHAKCKNV